MVRLTSLFRPVLLVISLAGTGADPRLVFGIVGQKALLPSGLQVKESNIEIVWEHVSSRTRILEYTKGKLKYYDTRYKGRVNLHLNDFSLEILSLQTQDAGDYEITITLDTGAQTVSKVRLEVYVPTPEPVSGTQILVQRTGTCNFTLTCSATSGAPTSFRWWKGGEALGNDSTHHLRGQGEMIAVHHTAKDKDVVYKCEAKNPSSTGTAQVRLKNVCKQTTSGLPWWVIMLIAIGVLIAIIGVFFIAYGCMLSATHVTWAELRAGWVNWHQEDPKSCASFCTLLWNPKSVI